LPGGGLIRGRPAGRRSNTPALSAALSDMARTPPRLGRLDRARGTDCITQRLRDAGRLFVLCSESYVMPATDPGATLRFPQGAARSASHDIRCKSHAGDATSPNTGVAETFLFKYRVFSRDQ
jgi:hypothetical protein